MCVCTHTHLLNLKSNQWMKKKDNKYLLLENAVLKACVQCTFWNRIAQNPESSQHHENQSHKNTAKWHIILDPNSVVIYTVIRFNISKTSNSLWSLTNKSKLIFHHILWFVIHVNITSKVVYSLMVEITYLTLKVNYLLYRR